MIRNLIFCMLLAASLTAQETLTAPSAPFVKGKKIAACVVGGVDFGANNDQRVVRGPGRNLLMNPSMESGLRYFTPPRGHEYAGDFPLALWDKDARSGKHSLRVTWDSQRSDRSAPEATTHSAATSRERTEKHRFPRTKSDSVF